MGASWRPAVPLQCHVEGLPGKRDCSFVALLPCSGPIPVKEQAAGPQGLQAGLVTSTALAQSPLSPLAARGRGAVLWVRVQARRQSGMKDDFLNCISVRGLSGLMS